MISPVIDDDVIIHSVAFFVDEQIKEKREGARKESEAE